MDIITKKDEVSGDVDLIIEYAYWNDHNHQILRTITLRIRNGMDTEDVIKSVADCVREEMTNYLKK